MITFLVILTRALLNHDVLALAMFSIDDACRSTRIILRVGNGVVLGPFGIQQNNLARISISQEHVPLLRNCEMIRIKFRL